MNPELPCPELPEPNYFGRLLDVLSAREIKIFIRRLRRNGELRVAEVLEDELAERKIGDRIAVDSNQTV